MIAMISHDLAMIIARIKPRWLGLSQDSHDCFY